MANITQLLDALQRGQPESENALIAAVYSQLRKLAHAKMAHEPAGTLQATALVHEAWLRLGNQPFENRAHFFGAASEAMRRILVERARRKQAAKRGANPEHVDMHELEIAVPTATDDEILAVHETLDRLEQHDARKADLVKLRYFAGFTLEESAEMLGISPATAKRDWEYARAWLLREVERR